MVATLLSRRVSTGRAPVVRTVASDDDFGVGRVAATLLLGRLPGVLPVWDVVRQPPGRSGTDPAGLPAQVQEPDRVRKSVVQGKRVTVRVDFGGRRSLKKPTTTRMTLYENT